MRNRIDISEYKTAYNHNVSTLSNVFRSSVETIEKRSVINILESEGCDNFINYIEWLGLANDPNMIILSSMHHFYYDSEELKTVNTVINLKELNQTKKIKNFFRSVFHILPAKSNFIGCFVDNSKINGYELRPESSNDKRKRLFDEIENGIISRNPFLNMLFSIMDLRTNKYMSRRIVTTLLHEQGFKVFDLTEIRGITYFCAQRLHTADN